MTFLAEAQIEARAAEVARRYALQPGFDVEGLLDQMGLGLVWEAIEDEEGAVLGQLVPAQRLVILNERHLARLESKDGRLLRYTVGHEIGHWILHCEAARLRQMPLFDSERIWCRDGATDPLERQAEMFSAALLIGREELRDGLPNGPWHGWPRVYALADRFLVNATPMKIRLERLSWMHCDENGIPRSGSATRPGQESLFNR